MAMDRADDAVAPLLMPSPSSARQLDPGAVCGGIAGGWPRRVTDMSGPVVA